MAPARQHQQGAVAPGEARKVAQVGAERRPAGHPACVRQALPPPRCRRASNSLSATAAAPCARIQGALRPVRRPGAYRLALSASSESLHERLGCVPRSICAVAGQPLPRSLLQHLADPSRLRACGLVLKPLLLLGRHNFLNGRALRLGGGGRWPRAGAGAGGFRLGPRTARAAAAASRRWRGRPAESPRGGSRAWRAPPAFTGCGGGKLRHWSAESKAAAGGGAGAGAAAGLGGGGAALTVFGLPAQHAAGRARSP